MSATLNILKFGYGTPRHIIHNFCQFLRNIKFAYQRVTRGYCDADVWDLDQYLSALLYKTLHQL